MEALNADADATYRIGYDGTKITIVAKDNESLVYAMSEFLRLYVPADTNGAFNIKETFSTMAKYSSSVDILENFAAVEILSTSTIQDTKKGRYWPTYGRILQLQHNGENNGALYATSQWSQKSFPIYKSTDDGKTWKLIAQVSEQLDKTLTANWQPHIFELPCQVGEMPEGTLLLAGCAYKPGVTDTYMCIWRSYDLGKTWEEFTVVDQGGGTDINDGMYEPFLICDEDGSLVCFYSDETEVWQNGGQRLVADDLKGYRCGYMNFNTIDALEWLGDLVRDEKVCYEISGSASDVPDVEAFVNFYTNMQAMLMAGLEEQFGKPFDITNADEVDVIYNYINDAVETINLSLVMEAPMSALIAKTQKNNIE
jgi:hypothetical protein